MRVLWSPFVPQFSMSAGHVTHPQPEAPLIIFFHVPKTAGTSFRQWLAQYFAGNVLFHPNSRKAGRTSAAKPTDVGTAAPIVQRDFVRYGAEVMDLKQLFRRFGVSAFHGYDAVGGHIGFDFPFVAAIDRPTLICSAVRDPVERILSLYNWARLNKVNRMHACVEGRTLFQSLRAKGRFFKESDNKQMDCIFGKRRWLSLGKSRSNNRWTMICRYDRYDLMLERIADIYGKPAIDLPHRNRVSIPYGDEIRAQPDFEEAVEFIRKLNAEEISFVASIGDFVELNPPQ